ncbi:hypothetical protein RZ737_004976 [Escherichia coli]|nr:hypothetical protein [Escherichia coli]
MKSSQSVDTHYVGDGADHHDPHMVQTPSRLIQREVILLAVDASPK